MKKEISEYIIALKQVENNTSHAEDRSVFTTYIADIAPILADLISNKIKVDINKAIDSHERLIGHTWMKDEKQYEYVYSKWKDVKDKNKSGN